MGWFSRTKKSPVMQPLQNGTANSSKTATGILSTKNNFGETSQTLRKIQKSASPEITLRSDKVTYSSDQYALIEAAGVSIMSVGNCIHDIHREAIKKSAARKRPEEKMIKFFNIEKERIDNFPEKFSLVDTKDPLLGKEFKLIKLSNELLSSYDNIKKITLNSDVGFFFDEDNFMYTTGHNFNDFCQKITDDKFFRALGTVGSFDKRDYLAHAGIAYAEKEIIKNQLPKVEAKFKALQNSGKTSKDLLSIVEKIIGHAKVGVRNMEHPERAAIFEQIAPVARPKYFDDFLGVLIKNKTLLNMSEKEIDAVYDKLRNIPFDLVP